MNKHINHKGFTIVELLIATSVFSTVLLISAAGILHVGKLFHKGITSGLTQEVARNTIDDIRSDFSLSGGYFAPAANNGPNMGFCIGSHLYSYQINRRIELNGTGHALVVREYPNCDTTPGVVADDLDGPPNATYPWREFLGPNMRLNSFSVSPSPTPVKPTGLTISINVISGEADLSPTGVCTGGPGSQFCSSSPLTVHAVRRLR
jgi:prepilin-type N-terminal cleavage/methylation domain-containing protein